jgi:hypothetical protein
VVQALVDVHGVVDHVGLGQQLDLRLQDLVIAVDLLVLQKLQQREDEVPVQKRRHSGGEVVLRHGDGGERGRGDGACEGGRAGVGAQRVSLGDGDKGAAAETGWRLWCPTTRSPDEPLSIMMVSEGYRISII